MEELATPMELTTSAFVLSVSAGLDAKRLRRRAPNNLVKTVVLAPTPIPGTSALADPVSVEQTATTK